MTIDDAQLTAYLAQRLDESLDRPLTSPGSENLARQVLEQFGGLNLGMAFAEKILETLRDGESHNRTAVSTSEPRVAVLFVAWYGTHREIQPERYGNYLTPLFALAGRITEMNVELAGILQIDAYVRGNIDADAVAPPDVAIDVEYSFLPGRLIGYPGEDSSLPNVLMLNTDLCSQDELQALQKFTA